MRKSNMAKRMGMMVVSLLLPLSSFLLLSTSCSDDKDGGGTPEITGVRSCDPALADSLFTKASPGQIIAVIGNNLSSALKVYINDQEAYFNPTMNTAHSLVVTVPTEKNGFRLTAFDSDLKDEIRVETTHGSATYAFKITAGYPSISRIQARYPRETGNEINIYGFNLVDIEQAYFTDLPAAQLEGTQLKEVGGNHVPISSVETIVKDHHLNPMTNAYETTSQLRFQMPDVSYSEGTLVLECAGGIAYVPYYKTPGKPELFTVSSDMPEIGETLVLTGREFVQVETVKYGDVTLGSSEFTVSESEDSIFVQFSKKPSVGSGTTLTVTTPGGSVSASRFYDHSTILTTFDGDATDNGWGPNCDFEEDDNDDGVYAHISVASEAQQWWGTMIFFRKDWSGEPFALPGYDAIPADASTDDVYLAMEVFNRNSDYNNGSFWGYLRYWLPNTTETNDTRDSSAGGPPYADSQYDNGFNWVSYDEGIGGFDQPVLADINGQAPLGVWYRHVLPLSRFGKYAGKTYQDVYTDGIHQFRIQSINQSTSRGRIDVKFDNVRIIYVPKN